MRNSSPDPYQLQKIALLPAVGSCRHTELRDALLGLGQERREELLELIIDQGLQFFWLEALKMIPELSFSSRSSPRLKESCLKHTARYLLQKKMLIEVDALLGSAGCVYAAFKGAQLREAVYEKPAYRPSVDIDILISPDEKEAVLKTLGAAGFTMCLDPANVSHEVSLFKDGLVVDLHWDIMRPGRIRGSVVGTFLQARHRQGYFWSLDNEAVLFIMLVHPVFTKYSTAPQSAIVRLVDICRWVEQKDIAWPRLIEITEKTGMKTASWVTLTVLENLTGKKFPDHFCKKVLPGQPRRGLLTFWLRRNLSARFVNFPALCKYIFTLLAHDSIVDALGFVYGAAREKTGRQAMLSTLEEIKKTAFRTPRND